MLIAEHTEETKVPARIIWKLWADVDHWNTWDHALEYTKINGNFVVGSSIKLKVKNGPLVDIVINKLEENKLFIDTTKLFLCTIIDTHTITQKQDSILVCHKIEMTGLLAFFFAFVIGRSMKKDLPSVMKAMIQKAERIYVQERA